MKKQIVFAALFLLIAVTVFSQGLIIPGHHRHPHFQQLKVTSQSVQVEIKGNAAITQVEQVFLNRNRFTTEGTYIFPVPKGASVTDFYLWIDGKKVKGELLEKQQAAKIYRDIVNRMKDPALLELTEFNIFKASIFPIPAGGERKIALKYSQPIVPSANLMAYEYPLKLRSNTMRETIGNFTFTMKIKSTIPVLTAYSPSHTVDIQRKDDKNITIGLEKTNYLPQNDLHIYLQLSDDEVGLSFASYRQLSSDDGYFMMMLSPKVGLEQKKTVAKDVIFVLDTSGSMMDHNKIKQAVEALKFGVSSLNEKDRFGVITYATTVNTFRDTLLPATEENKAAVRKHLSTLRATGATNIHDALKTGFSMFSESDRPGYLIFLTDGLPTAVERNPVVIAQKAKEWDKNNVRLFSWGVGYDVNAVLLDTLARDHKGSSEYVKPKEEMELKMSNFFEKIAYPVMTNLALSFHGITVKDYYPLQLPDLFKGSRVVLFGRFQGEEKGKITLKGKIGDKAVEFTHEIVKNRIEDGDFIANLWATRKVGFLLEEIRINGQNSELKDEVIRLAKKYGIVTPYTSYLVTEPEADTRGGVRRRAQNRPGNVGEEVITITGEAPLVDVRSTDEPAKISKELFQALPKGRKFSDLIAVAPVEKDKDSKIMIDGASSSENVSNFDAETGQMIKKGSSGKDAVDISKKLGQIKEANKMERKEGASIRKIGEKTFVLLKGIWIDNEFQKGMKVKEIKFGSEEYFGLLQKHRSMARWLSLGDAVVIVWDNTALVITK